MIVHMRKMREAAASVHRQRAVDRALAVLPPDITPVEAYRLGLSRGRNMGYQSGLRLARKFEAELQRLQNGTV